MCLLAVTNDDHSLKTHQRMSLIIVPMDLKGISKNKIDKMGMRSSDTGMIFFENVKVPRHFIIGEEGKGFLYQMLQFQASSY